MSVLTYNKVSLPFTYTTQFEQSDVYDDSDTDRLYTKYQISVSAVVNTAYAGIAGVAGDTPAAMMIAMRNKLMEPRKFLTFTVGGIDLIPSSGSTKGTGADMKNGPHPQYFNCTRLTNETFLVHYSIITHIYTGEDGKVAKNNAVSNRWTETVDIDGRNYTTRTRSGKVVIRANCGSIADKLRFPMAVLGVPQGFLRVSSNYTISPDGLTLSYTVVDREVYRLPPAPAYQAEGEYTESTTNLGQVRWGQCRITLRGDKETDYAELLKVALGVCSGKLLTAGAERSKGGGFGKLEQFAVQVNLFDNVVTVQMRAMLKMIGRSKTAQTVAGVDFKNITSLPTPAESPTYKMRGTAGYLLQAAAYWDPALKDNALDAKTGQIKQGTPPGEG